MTRPDELRLDDSEVAAIEAAPGGLILRLSAAAVRRRAPDGQATDGHMTGVSLILEGGTTQAPAEAGACWLGRIREGHWIVEGRRMSALPRSDDGTCPGLGHLSLTFQRGDTFDVQGATLKVDWPEADTFRESLAC